MNEFALIELIRATLDAPIGAEGGIGDDATILEVPGGEQLVTSTDTLVEGVHFDKGAAPQDIGYKALAVNLSDLAAMGATPRWFLLALTHPELDSTWVQAFASGLAEAARTGPIKLSGGDTTRGPLSITITVMGTVLRGEALLRSGACAGEIIGISGNTGLAGWALKERSQGRDPGTSASNSLDRPLARVELGRELVGLASSCIDISDGLVADLGHIAAASDVGMQIILRDLPVAPELVAVDEAERWNLQLGAGDDYELCFTASPENWNLIKEKAKAIDVPVSRIGNVVEGQGCTCLLQDGQIFEPSRAGYNHGAVDGAQDR